MCKAFAFLCTEQAWWLLYLGQQRYAAGGPGRIGSNVMSTSNWSPRAAPAAGVAEMRYHRVSGQPECGQWTVLRGVGLAWVCNGDVEHCKQVYPGDYGLQMWTRNLLIMGGMKARGISVYYGCQLSWVELPGWWTPASYTATLKSVNDNCTVVIYEISLLIKYKLTYGKEPSCV